MEHALDINHVPLMISSICILYYYEDEIFDIVGHDMTLSMDKRCITCSVSTKNNNIFGTIQVPSQDQCICRWDLILKRELSTLDLNYLIGISSTMHPSTTKMVGQMDGYRYVLWNDGEIDNNTYGFYDGPSYSKYCDEFTGNNAVSIKLNLKLRQVSFIINGKDQGVAFDDIGVDTDIKYRLFIRLYRGQSVQIVNFCRS